MCSNHKSNHYANQFLERLKLYSESDPWREKIENKAMVLYEKDRRILPSHRNKTLYVTASVHAMKLKYTLTDPASSLNAFITLKVVRIS